MTNGPLTGARPPQLWGDVGEPPQPAVAPSYLAKDYASFLQLLRETVSVTLPQWTETHAADSFVQLLELLAYVGDRLSYYQDAVATEAYLGTARLRLSVRRHARLLGYRMHEGCNARTLVCLQVSADAPIPLDEACFITTPTAGNLTQWVLPEAALLDIPLTAYRVYEPMERGERMFRVADNIIDVDATNTGGVLPSGATSAVLRQSNATELRPGSVLVFAPRSGLDSSRPRHPVRLTHAEDEGARWHVQWAPEDAVPWTLPIHGPSDTTYAAMGNAVLVDHGVRLSRLRRICRTFSNGANAAVGSNGANAEVRLSPSQALLLGDVRLSHSPLTFAAPVDLGEQAPTNGGFASAASLLQQHPRTAQPAIFDVRVSSPDGVGDQQWWWRADLLHSGPDDRHVAVEVTDDGTALLRFGDGELGAQLPDDATVSLDYRIGNGTAGDVAPDQIRHLVLPDLGEASVTAVSNPLTAVGTPPEPVDAVRLLAPEAIRTPQARAVTAADYASIAEDDARVQAARAHLEWSGTCHRCVVLVDARGRDELPSPLREDLQAVLESRRMVGHQVVVRAPRYAPVKVVVGYRLDPSLAGSQRQRTLAALRQALGGGHADGTPGFFHPDRFSFGDPVPTSAIVTTALGVTGVLEASVLSLAAPPSHPDVCGDTATPGQGVLTMGPFEIARLATRATAPGGGLTLTDLASQIGPADVRG